MAVSEWCQIDWFYDKFYESLWKILVKIDFEAAFALIYNIKIVYILLVNKVIYEWPQHMSKNKFTNGTDVFKKCE